MFYYPNVLHRHSGCFSTIWLAATKGIKISRREFLKVNVRSTCEDIINYVTVKVPPPQPNLPRPRFSLYLSSQLQYGVVIVYHRQCGFLLEEVQQAIERLLRSKRHGRIDMAEPDRLALDMPDCLCLMEEAGGAQDPFFGLMDLNKLPSPYKIPQQLQLMEEVSPHRSLVSSPRTTPDDKGFRSPPAAITLKEKEQLVINTAEFEGAELPEATTKEIDMLMDQQDQFHYKSTDVEERERERVAERERSKEVEGAMTSIDQLRETLLEPGMESLWLLDEETGRPVEVPLATIPMEMTPIPTVTMPTPAPGSSEKQGELEKGTESSYGEVDVPGRRRGRGGGRGRRRRQLVFADTRVQIAEDTMKEQIETPLIETLSLSEVLLDLPTLAKRKTSAQLFSAPTSSLLHPDLQSLWKQCAHLTTLPRSGDQRRQEEEVEEEREESQHDRETLRKERKRRDSSMREISRDVVEGLQPPEASSASSIILDVSKEDKSLSDLITPANRCSSQLDVQVCMEPIVEEQVDMPEFETDTSWEITAQNLLGMVSSYLQRYGKVTFDTLLPPEADRTTAAQAFSKLLELVSVRELGVCQIESYDLITITCGPLTMTA